MHQDFFYICKSHLGDKGFATPVIDEKAEAAKRKKEAMDKEIEMIRQEYDEKQKSKKAKKKAKDDKDKKADEEDSKAEKERDEKVSPAQTECIASAYDNISRSEQFKPARNPTFQARMVHGSSLCRGSQFLVMITPHCC